jgi:hypothetical protein
MNGANVFGMILFAIVGLGFIALAVLIIRAILSWFWHIFDILEELRALGERLDRINAQLKAGINVWPQALVPRAQPEQRPPGNPEGQNKEVKPDGRKA